MPSAAELAGAKVKHSAEELGEGETMILTLGALRRAALCCAACCACCAMLGCDRACCGLLLQLPWPMPLPCSCCCCHTTATLQWRLPCPATAPAAAR